MHGLRVAPDLALTWAGLHTAGAGAWAAAEGERRGAYARWCGAVLALHDPEVAAYLGGW